MMDKIVTHVKYGTGRIVEVDGSHISVVFEEMEGRKIFRYPDAFEKFLNFEDPVLQRSAEAAAIELNHKKMAEEKLRLAAYQLCETKRRQEQSELLKKRRKAARERQAREKMPRVI